MDSCSSIQDAPREAPPLTESGSSQKEIVGYQFKLKTAKKGSACTAFPRHASRSCGPPSVASHTPVRCFQEGLREWENWKCIWHNSSFELPALRAGGKKKMSHPFGKEEAASQKQLFGFFCECLRRGEWELARACVPQLHEGPGDLPKRVEDILQALVVCPNLLR